MHGDTREVRTADALDWPGNLTRAVRAQERAAAAATVCDSVMALADRQVGSDLPGIPAISYSRDRLGRTVSPIE